MTLGGTSPAQPRRASQGYRDAIARTKRPTRAGSLSGRPRSAGTARAVCDYAQLSRQAKQAGLSPRRPGRHIWKITVTLLAAGWAVFALAGDSWRQLGVAASWQSCSPRPGFPDHDAAHRQIPRSPRASHIPGHLPANPGTGLSYRRRAGQHTRHRAHPHTGGADRTGGSPAARH